MAEWMALAQRFKGWSLTEIKELSSRERSNWLEVAREYSKAVKKRNG
jgi:hypothetical protein